MFLVLIYYKIQLIPVMEKLNFQCHMIQCHIHVPDLLSILKTVVLLLIFLWKPLFIINLLNPNFWAVCAISFCLTENQTINLFKTCSKPKIVKKIIILSFVFYPSLASLPGRCPWTAQDSRWALSCLRGCGLTFSVEQIVRLSAVKCIKSYSNSSAVLLDQIRWWWALFVTYTIIQSIMRSEMCSLHLTHPSVHTWSSGQPTVQRPGSSRGLPARAGIRTHNLGLPQVSSPTLYPLGQRLP